MYNLYRNFKCLQEKSGAIYIQLCSNMWNGKLNIKATFYILQFTVYDTSYHKHPSYSQIT